MLSRNVNKLICPFCITGGYDTHSDILPRFMNLATDLNDAIEAFVNETKAQGLWDSTTIVITTEFARTLTTNTGVGSDHAWGKF